MLVLFFLTFSFILGYIVAQGRVSTKIDTAGIFSNRIQTVNLKNKPSIRARIVRSGDRGILLYEPDTDQLRFMLWEAIKSIDATPER